MLDADQLFLRMPDVFMPEHKDFALDKRAPSMMDA